ncbi:MAG TPA: indolepyruvate ferredoxin oxidoreductase family protein [Gemmatimonadales bacterium]|nr:indolepyruvate ferredoxin oxidoreductase family protein [Gemmatimonadales bacterium]
MKLDDKYRLEEGTIALSGVQALVRLPLDQHRADGRAGLNTATLISGYRGSPLGGYDSTLQAAAKVLAEHQVTFLPGVNEDLGATAVFGSQLANLLPNPKYDGVLGIWYGKGPGVDRTGDAFRHANLTGVGKYGGVLAVAGDDPASKSSTVPSASEVALFDAQMPILYPSDAQGVLDLGLKGFALSRYSGLWVGFKLTTNVADEFSTALVSPSRAEWVRPEFEFRGKPWQPTQSHTLIPPYNLDLEQELWEGRLEAARHFGAANRLNRTTVDAPGAWLGIVAPGKTYLDLREALIRLGFSDDDLRRAGVRLFRVDMLYPLDAGTFRRFASGLEEVLVIEEKRNFLELLVRDALYNMPDRPRVVGKRDEQERILVPGHGELEAESLLPVLVARLRARLGDVDERLARIAAGRGAIQAPLGLPMQRLAYFCSGCPHNRSTVVPEGSIAAAGIGCHGMAITMERIGAGFTQMGGEGAQWVGASFFTGTPHLFQNIGDGTLFHSGSLAIRQAIASGANITYKILYNGAVAMTGGQHADGAIGIPDLTRELAAEGVRRTVVLTDEPERYDGVTLAPGVGVFGRENLDQVQRELRNLPGVTALIYDQHCAADLRRKRKRGLAPERAMRVIINERVCEGCGDCGVKSNCLSVLPVDTEFGRKTRIHQSSCNTDYSCLEGDCPAFVTAIPVKAVGAVGAVGAVKAFEPIGADLPAPADQRSGDTNLYLMGIGGTGVVTVNQVLGTAALMDGYSVRCLDQTGLSQKGGAVVSHLKITAAPAEVSNKVGLGEADGYIGFDLLTAADSRHLMRTRPDRSVAIISSSRIPTGLMVRNAAVPFPESDLLHRRINASTLPGRNVYLDADGLASSFFGSHMAANFIVVGAAFQAGLMPMKAETIEQAITLNGASTAMNIQAFRLGRQLVLDPAWSPGPEDPRTETAVPTSHRTELERLLAIRVPDLVAYQNEAYATTYREFVDRVARRESELGLGSELAESVARYLYKLMAYKDEYEVARLSLDPGFDQIVKEAVGEGAKISWRLHPPALRAMGLKKKLSLGAWFRPVFRLLRWGRRVRGTALDPFGRDAIRKLERELIVEYRELIERELATLSAETHARAVALAKLPDMVRGYEDVKRKNVERYRLAIAATLTEAAPERVAAAVG